MGHGSVYLWNLPRIESLNDLASQLQLSPNVLRRLYQFPSRHYRTVSIPKRSGGERVIHCPGRTLKAVQRWILYNILSRVPVEQAAAAYYKGASPIKNARKHADNSFFVKLDLKDFFPSIKTYRVYTVFRALGYDSSIAYMLKELCTLEDMLPQGAVTSPALSNIICKRLDRRLSRLAGNRHVVYTRYADDITFSAKTPERVHRCLTIAVQIIEDEGFRLNPDKTCIIGKRRQPIVTGVAVIPKGHVGPTRSFKRKVRAAAFRLANESDPLAKEKVRQQLEGFKAFWQAVEPGMNVTSRVNDMLSGFYLKRLFEEPGE